MKERLQKHLARSGLGSRRYCETLIEQGRVRVNGKIIDRAGFQVDAEVDEIEVDGQEIAREEAVYYMLHKPKGFVCSSRPQGDSRTALALVESRHGERLFCVGRLDEESQGALLLTNDGEFSNRVTHPRYGVEKTYLVRVKGKPEGQILEKIRRGVHLAEGKTAPAKVHVIKRSRSYSLVKVSIHEGKNRHLRRIFARVGLPVTDIIRVQIGSVVLGNLKPGQYRALKPAEIESLMDDSQPRAATAAADESAPEHEIERIVAAPRSTGGAAKRPGGGPPKRPGAPRGPRGPRSGPGGGPSRGPRTGGPRPKRPRPAADDGGDLGFDE